MEGHRTLKAFEVGDDGVARHRAARSTVGSRVALGHTIDFCVNFALFRTFTSRLRPHAPLTEGDLRIKLGFKSWGPRPRQGIVHVGSGEPTAKAAGRRCRRMNLQKISLASSQETDAIHALSTSSAAPCPCGSRAAHCTWHMPYCQHLLKPGLSISGDDLRLAVSFSTLFTFMLVFPPIRCGPSGTVILHIILLNPLYSIRVFPRFLLFFIFSFQSSSFCGLKFT